MICLPDILVAAVRASLHLAGPLKKEMTFITLINHAFTTCTIILHLPDYCNNAAKIA